VIERTIRSGDRSVIAGSSASIVIIAGASTVDRMSCAWTARANPAVLNGSSSTTPKPARKLKSMFHTPAHRARDTGMRFIRRVPPPAGGCARSRPRSFRRLASSAAIVPLCRSRTALGRPVVPDVREITATSGG